MNTAFPKTLGLIPARKGSRGVPHKNMKLLGTVPLIQYTIAAALCSRLLHKIIVSTDCPETARFCNGFERITTPFLRPAFLAADETPMIDVVQHALEFAQDQWGPFDYLVLLQPTSPFRMPGLVNGALRQIEARHADSLLSIRKVPDTFNPYWTYFHRNHQIEPVMGHQGRPITRRQDLPDSFHRDGQIYIARSSLIVQGLLTGGSVSAWFNNDEFGVNIDTMADWSLAEKLLKKWKKQTNNHF